MASTRRRRAILCVAAVLALAGAPGARAAARPGSEPSVSVYAERLPSASGGSVSRGVAARAAALPARPRSALAAAAAGLHGRAGLVLLLGSLAAAALVTLVARRS